MRLERFKGFYEALDRALDLVPHDRIESLVFTRRDDLHTCALIMKHQFSSDREIFEKLIKLELEDEFYTTPTGFIAYMCADLESIDTDRLRLYKNQPQNVPNNLEDDWMEATASYVDTQTGETLGTKTYLRSVKDKCYYIDYYDKDNNLVAEKQKEFEGTYEDWNGPKEIVDIAIEEDMPYVFARKESKDQGYLIIGNRKKSA